MSVDLSGEIAAIATAILAAFAIVTAIFAVLAFRKQSQEVRDQASMLSVQSEQLTEQRKINEKQTEVLALQARELSDSLEERRREASEQRRAQASRVFIYEEHMDVRALEGRHVLGILAERQPTDEERSQPVVVAHVMNTSQQPVYNVIISWHLGTRPESQRHLPALMPGAEDKDIRPVPPDADLAIFGAVAFFRDAAGALWRTQPDGNLEEIPAGQEPSHTW